MRILNIVTVSASAGFLRSGLSFMKRRNWQVAICSSPGERLRNVAQESGADFFEVPMEREISPLRDLRALWRLYWLIRKYRPIIVNAGTPKAGLLGMMAAMIAGVPVRVFQQRGLRLETAKGIRRRILLITEWLTCRCANRVICNSESLKQCLFELNLVSHEKAKVLGSGSSGGVDTVRFSLNYDTLLDSFALQRKFKLPVYAPVIGFVGRLVKDKGIGELVESFKRILVEFPEARLLVVGRFEQGDSIGAECTEWLRGHPNVIIAGQTDSVESYYPLMDVLAFPSHREGFPNVVLEAAAMRVPSVGFRATGVVDAIVDGQTGTIVPFGNIDALSEAILCYLRDRTLRLRHGHAARMRVARDFQPQAIIEALYREYIDLLRNRKLTPPELDDPEKYDSTLHKEDTNGDIDNKWFVVKRILLDGESLETLCSEWKVSPEEIRGMISIFEGAS